MHDLNFSCSIFQNSEFHDTIDNLAQWLENTEEVIRNSEPVDLIEVKVIIETQYRKYKVQSKIYFSSLSRLSISHLDFVSHKMSLFPDAEQRFRQVRTEGSVFARCSRTGFGNR